MGASISKFFARFVVTDQIAAGSESDVAEENEDKGEFLENKGDAQPENKEDKGAKSGAGLPIDVFETGIGNITDHQQGNGEHQRRHDDG